jgi:hypothetical protein
VARSKPLLIALLLGLVLAGVALADKPIIRLNAADQAAARAVVLKASDLGTAWKGGFKTPDLTSAPPCGGYHPKQSDLVTTGAAETEFQNSGTDIDSEAQIQQTAAMVKLDWKRTFTPQLLTCLRAAFKQSFGTKATVVSVDQVAFPRVGALTRAYRALIDVPSGGTKIRLLTDLVAFGGGRTELTLRVTTAARAGAAVHVLEIQLAHLMVGRAKA